MRVTRRYSIFVLAREHMVFLTAARSNLRFCILYTFHLQQRKDSTKKQIELWAELRRMAGGLIYDSGSK